MNDFLSWSGWAFGLIGVIFGIIQFNQKTKYKNKYEKIIKNTNSNNTSVQANNGGIAVIDNNGGIHIGK